ncbi:hypothetical protein QBC43DRAFT_370764 [Cladorrhinum sp. PSN259]|nr:hypothetical protein QBC43DRAFT_370764 [Cladorrhinum sp. PSN259]
MEHLPLPRNPIRQHPEATLSSRQFDDPCDFLDYPTRHNALVDGGYPHVPTQVDVINERTAAGVSSDDILDYYQGWLFFSLLSEIFGPTYDEDNYLRVVREGDDEKAQKQDASEDAEQEEEREEQAEPGKILRILLSTEHLHSDLLNWRTNGPLSTIVEGGEYHQFLDSVLDTAFEAFDKLESSFTGFTAAFPDEILCLAALCETIDSFVVTAIEHGPLAEMPHRMFPSQAKRRWLSKVSDILDFDDSSLREGMLNAGWCPGDISRMRESFSSIAAYYYFGNFQPDPRRANLHAECPAWGCTLQAPAKTTHVDGGTDEECDCPGMVSFDEPSLIAIYEAGNIPCFTIGRMEGGSLGVALTSISLDEEAQKDPENRYVALSHVWSEGMGNAAGNGLPFCRLSVTQYWCMLAQQIVQQSEDDQGSGGKERDPYATGIKVESEAKTVPVNIWIDTMCCPATPGYGKNLCLAKMREIYANAYAVLVRSEQLEDMHLGEFTSEPERGIMDVAAQLYTSPWMRRMWTLQEAVLAGMRKTRKNGDADDVGGRLVLGYGGGLLSLESVVGLLKQAPAHEAALAFDMIGKFGPLTPMPYGFDDDEMFGGNRQREWNGFLSVLTTALKYRGVSVPTDELICLATMLGVRVKNAEGDLPLGTEFEEGMCELWRRIGKQNMGIPGDIIFSSVPRINIDGFRWAPKTFIQHAKYGEVYWSFSDGDGDGDKEPERIEITEAGLKVQYSGVSLTVNLEIHGAPLVRQSGKVPQARAQRVMFMQLPADSENWYSIHIHQLDKDDLEDRLDQLSLGPTLLEQVAGGNMVLLLKDAEPAGRGLLVTTKDDTPSESGTQVRSKYPVTIGPVAPSTAYICSLIQGEMGRLRSILASAGEDQEKSESLLRTELAELLSKHESNMLRSALVIEALGADGVSASEEQVMDTFVKVANLVAELGGVGAREHPNQSWIVD